MPTLRVKQADGTWKVIPAIVVDPPNGGVGTITVDATLSKPGMAADAAATGKAISQLTKETINKQQGSANAGKILVVGADGNLALADMPETMSGDIVGVIDEHNNIIIMGNLGEGTYTFKYENTDGTYADIGSLVVGGNDNTPAYINWIPKSINVDGSIYNGKGYKEDTRISTSSGNESNAPGMSVTGFIPVHLDGRSEVTVRIKDIDLTSSASTSAWYDSEFRFLTGNYCNSLFDAADANGVRSYTSTSPDRAYIRISGAFGSNPIITVDEEITD